MKLRVFELVVLSACVTVTATLRAAASEADAQGRTAWLGKQLEAKALLNIGNLDMRSIELFVFDGKDVELEPKGYLVVCIKGEIRSATPKDISPRAGTKYLWGRITHPGVLVYNLDVAIKGGPLAGATVHLRDGKIPGIGGKLVDVMECLYEIPDGVAIDEGEVMFDVIQVSQK